MVEYDIGRFVELLEKLEKMKSQPRSIKKDYMVEETTNSEICAECGGMCCKKCGCHFSPDDFVDVSFEGLKTELEKGYISIDYVSGEMIDQRGGFYILRIRNRGAKIVDLEYKRTPCILLTESGCKLGYGERPTGGKLLIPSAEFHNFFGEMERNCHSAYTIEDCCMEWKPYQEILGKLVHYFKDKDFSCLL